MAEEECPLELTLATLRAQCRSSSAGEGTVERPRGRQARRPNDAQLYAELRALLPDMPSSHQSQAQAARPWQGQRQRMNHEEVLDAAVAHVKVLEDTVAVLEAYRGLRATPRRAEVSVSGATVCFSARLPAAGPGALRRVLETFDRRGVEVLAATVARHGGRGGGGVADAVVTVTTAAAAPEVLEMIRVDIACIP